MRVNNNISSLNAWRNLNSTDGAMGKSLERLSSGYRINRAGDDVAGLAILREHAGADQRPEPGREERSGRHLAPADR